MGRIVKRLQVLGDRGRVRASVLFDSGATTSIVRKDVAERVATLIRRPAPRRFTLADGKTTIETQIVAVIDIAIDGVSIDDEFYVVEQLSRPVIVGAATMQKWDIRLHLKDESIRVGIDPNHIELALMRWVAPPTRIT